MKLKFICFSFLTICIATPAQSQDNRRLLPPLFSPNLDNPNQGTPESLDVPQIDPIHLPAGQEQSFFGIINQVQVRSISFDGNNVISDEQIQVILDKYEGKIVSTEDLQELEKSLISLYAEQGYLASGGFISPETTLSNNQLDLRIFINEAKITKLTVVGAGHLNSYIQRQLSPLNGELLDADKIYNKMRFLLNDERIDDIRLDIIQTPQIERKELLFNVEANDSIQITTILNNGRSPSIGSFERRVIAHDPNLIGFGDQFTVDYRNTDGSNIVGVSYDIPVNASGGKIELNYLDGNAEVVQGDLRQFDIQGKTQIFAIGFSQPVLRRSTNKMSQEVTFGIRASHTRNKDSILGFSFPLTEGDTDDGRLRSTKLDLNQSYTYKTRRHYVYLGSEFSLGLGLGTVNAEEFGNGEFFKWTGQALYSYRFSDRFRSISYMNLQLADRDLIGNEQFSLGGRGSVRAYSSNQLARTNGGHFIQEFRYKAYDDNNGNQIEVSAFFDFGTAWNNQPQFLEQDESMGGLGFGISYQLDKSIRASLEYAFPLFGPDSATESLQDQGVWLNLQFSF